jgi:hypothetical protein
MVGAGLHLAGGVMGGAALGLVLAPLALVPTPSLVWSMIGILLVLATLGDLGVTRSFYPSSRRQVPERWRKLLPPDLTFFLYGVGLGVAVFTRIRSVAFFAGVAFAVASGRPLAVITVCAAFGLFRGLAVIVPAGFLQPYRRAVNFVDVLAPRGYVAGTVSGLATTLLSASLIGLGV